MFEKLFLLVKNNAGRAVIDNPVIAAKDRDAVIIEASSSIIEVLKNQMENGRLTDLVRFFQYSGVYSTALISSIVNRFANKLNNFYGIEPDAARNTAAMLIPDVLQQLVRESQSGAEEEFALGNIANSGADEDIPLQHELLQDPGIAIIRNLIFEFRASMLISGLKMTCRLVKLQIGTKRFHQLLKNYCATHESEIFGYASALRFARFLEEQQLDIPYLQGMLDFELAAAQTFIDGKTRTLHLSFDPFLLLDNLVQWQAPPPPSSSAVQYQVEIHPDASITDKDALLRFNAVAHM